MVGHTALLVEPAEQIHSQRPEPKLPARQPKVLPFPQVPLSAARGANWLAEALLEMSPTRPKRRFADVLASFMLHSAILAVAILVPLYFSDGIDLKQFTQTLLIAPPPPPPPPAAPMVAKRTSAPRRVFTSAGKLLAPTAIPQKVAMLKEEALAPEIGAGVEGGVPGGVPGGQMGGVIGGIISGSRTAIPAPPPPSRSKAPVRVGGDVKPPRCIRKVEPLYPALAKETRIQGQVLIDAVIDEQGNVVEMHVVSGHPLFLQSAMSAVRNWKYEPTYLNGQPIAVQLIVTITFQLST